jgi:conjugal transfer pilus assembly protein TraE
MKLPWQKTTWEASIKSNIALSISNLVLVVITAGSVMHAMSVKENVVLTPPRIDEQLVIGWDSANEAYLKSFGLYTAMLVANITASNAQFVADSLSQFVDSSIYPTVRKTILATAETRMFKEAAAGTKFQPNSISYEPSTQKVFVVGESSLLTSVGNQEGGRAVVYEMKIRIVERRPVIYSLESYEGAFPHTAEWVKDHTPINPAKPPDEAQ